MSNQQHDIGCTDDQLSKMGKTYRALTTSYAALLWDRPLPLYEVLNITTNILILRNPLPKIPHPNRKAATLIDDLVRPSWTRLRAWKSAKTEFGHFSFGFCDRVSRTRTDERNPNPRLQLQLPFLVSLVQRCPKRSFQGCENPASGCHFWRCTQPRTNLLSISVCKGTCMQQATLSSKLECRVLNSLMHLQS